MCGGKGEMRLQVVYKYMQCTQGETSDEMSFVIYSHSPGGSFLSWGLEEAAFHLELSSAQLPHLWNGHRA